MIRWQAIAPLILISAAIMGSPGPATISLVAAGAARGIRRSFPYLIGIVAGTIVVLFAVALGITAILLSVPVIRSIVIWLSAAYIVWLAYHIATAAPALESKENTGTLSFAAGAVLGVANPKGWVAIAAVFASVRLADAPTIDAVAKVCVLSVMIVAICVTWLLAGKPIAPLLKDQRRFRAFNVALAFGLLAATALALIR